MGNTSNKAEKKVDTIDYVSSLNNIKQGVVVMNPSSTTPKNLLESRDEIDNAAWVDFSEIRFFIEPPLAPLSSTTPQVPITPHEKELLNDIDENGGDAQNFLVNFLNPFHDAISKGVSSRIQIENSSMGGFIENVLSQTPDGPKITATWWERIQTSPFCLIKTYEYYINFIVGELTGTYLLVEDLEKIANLFFTVIALDPNYSQYYKDEFFKIIENHFKDGYDHSTLWRIYTTIQGLENWEAELSQLPQIWAQVILKLYEKFGIAIAEEAYTFTPPSD